METDKQSEKTMKYDKWNFTISMCMLDVADLGLKNLMCCILHNYQIITYVIA